MQLRELTRALNAVDQAMRRHCENPQDKARVLGILMHQYISEQSPVPNAGQGELFVPPPGAEDDNCEPNDEPDGVHDPVTGEPLAI